MSIVSETDINSIVSKSSSDLDQLDYGVVQVDDAGVIKQYNRYESELGNVAQPAAMGKNFFTQIAPCTNNRLIFGKFKDGVSAGALNETVPYVFSYKMRPTNVSIQMHRHDRTRTNWIFVKKR